MKELERYYKVLGLQIGASLEEINQAYRDLAFIWHPDRLPKDNERLLAKAVAKLQEINHAREQLKSIQVLSQPSSRTQVSQEKPSPSSVYRDRRPSESQAQRPYYRDLTGVDLRGANLKEKDLSGRTLIQANLSYADLSDTFLHKVNLEQANLFRANLFRANLLQANLRQANLQEVNLIGADLSGADLSEADLSGAKVSAGNRILVKLTGTILRGAILPDGTIHP
ncbi:pentapeptide repeat-containing protein [Crocosphaera sp. UHCC 0190]|uniref:pentapeptide repeat-containing protein n=1 Tax=Crocosphaera sp. UHCC 0190 TaxID=3110246 RepID=UPI002B1FAB54|nr:pentapeptide repeat-containing protein [Crocosphaera sp. UHCC 0190]MEA5510814.1 pentapeptide repeat-containing protein [Crocosphaera sp. UHCC 0190]